MLPPLKEIGVNLSIYGNFSPFISEFNMAVSAKKSCLRFCALSRESVKIHNTDRPRNPVCPESLYYILCIAGQKPTMH